MPSTAPDDARIRCPWAKGDRYVAYHDSEWGTPVHDDRVLFEFLILEGAQAGLSWEIILKKRDNYRRAFDHCDPALVAAYDDARQERLLADPGIVRNRLKVRSAVKNAQGYLKIQQEYGSFDAYLWRFVDGEPKQNRWAEMAEVPAHTPESDALSKDLKRRGFNFVGSTICYAFMQAVGMVNDHLLACYRQAELGLQAGAASGNGGTDRESIPSLPSPPPRSESRGRGDR